MLDTGSRFRSNSAHFSVTSRINSCFLSSNHPPPLLKMSLSHQRRATHNILLMRRRSRTALPLHGHVINVQSPITFNDAFILRESSYLLTHSVCETYTNTKYIIHIWCVLVVWMCACDRRAQTLHTHLTMLHVINGPFALEYSDNNSVWIYKSR